MKRWTWCSKNFQEKLKSIKKVRGWLWSRKIENRELKEKNRRNRWRRGRREGRFVRCKTAGFKVLMNATLRVPRGRLAHPWLNVSSLPPGLVNLKRHFLHWELIESFKLVTAGGLWVEPARQLEDVYNSLRFAHSLLSKLWITPLSYCDFTQVLFFSPCHCF